MENNLAANLNQIVEWLLQQDNLTTACKEELKARNPEGAAHINLSFSDDGATSSWEAIAKIYIKYDSVWDQDDLTDEEGNSWRQYKLCVNLSWSSTNEDVTETNSNSIISKAKVIFYASELAAKLNEKFGSLPAYKLYKTKEQEINEKKEREDARRQRSFMEWLNNTNHTKYMRKGDIKSIYLTDGRMQAELQTVADITLPDIFQFQSLIVGTEFTGETKDRKEWKLNVKSDSLALLTRTK